MAKIYYDKDTDLKLLDGKVIGIVGYGSQGHAHAQNLRDSGCQVIVAEAEGGPGWQKAKEAGFQVSSTDEVAEQATALMLAWARRLLPHDRLSRQGKWTVERPEMRNELWPKSFINPEVKEKFRQRHGL